MRLVTLALPIIHCTAGSDNVNLLLIVGRCHLDIVPCISHYSRVSAFELTKDIVKRDILVFREVLVRSDLSAVNRT